MIKNYKQIVICPNCDHIQEELIANGDKYAWICNHCSGAFEGNKPHLLQKEAEFTETPKGFGYGRPGHRYHKVIE
jgi:hypothetical protein